MTRKPIDGIAIIGMAGRFPGSATLEGFWKNIHDGVESITQFSREQLVRAGVDPELVDRSDYVRAKGVLADVELFDAWFFGFSPREAEITDPQHRIFLECCWEVLENAGYNPSHHAGTTGVYAGAGINTYLLSNLMTRGAASGLADAFQISIHNKNDHLTTRVAYKLNLKGPAITVQTACSSSLVAVSLACHSLLSYQTDMALAGGVSINVPQIRGYVYEEGGTASPDGHCRAFDARARGTVDGNGAGVVLLKRLDEALADRDHIYAVISGVAINNDGGLKQGYTAPGVESQAEVIAMAQAMAGVEAHDISYVEAHGTGTPLGDPIELAALTQAFSASTRKTRYCALGSVKTNIGHLDAAAGVAGLIKTVLALQHRVIPPTLHFENPNPRIDFEKSPFRVNSRLVDWTRDGSPRRAGVSSFGIGGTNAHVVVEEAPQASVGRSDRRWHVLPLSAATDSALEAATENLASHLSGHSNLAIADVAYTLQIGRAVSPHRRAAVCRDAADAVVTLRSLSPDRVVSRHQEKMHRPVIFLFPGQGSQYVNMAAALYRYQPGFRREVDRCSELLESHIGRRLREVLFPAAAGAGAMTELLDRTDLTQPALFTIEYALARFWIELGLQPQAMLGHSIGEYVAACLSGVFRLEDALAVVAFRGALMQRLPEGAMLAVSLSERQLAPMLDEDMSLAAVNGTAQCVISGPPAAAERCEALLAARAIPVRRLPASRAFHSTMTEPAQSELRGYLERVQLNPPRIPFISNLTGTWITPAEATAPDYWARHLRYTVRFADGLDEVLKLGDALLIEVGPGKTLKTLARWSPAKSPGQIVITSLPSRDAPADGDSHFLQAVGEAWLSGVEVDWLKLHEGEQRGRVPLPTYPFERQRYWIEPGAPPAQPSIDRPDIADWFYVPVWKRSPLERSLDHVGVQAGRRWLVFVDAAGFGDRVAQSLRSRGALVVTVTAGNGFERFAADRFRVDPTNPADYHAVFEALQTREMLPELIVHAWTIGLDSIGQHARSADLGFDSLLSLVQALGQRSAESISLTVLSTGLQSVATGDVVSPEKAMLLGAVHVIPREYDRIRCRSIDVVLAEVASADNDGLIDSVLSDTMGTGAEPLSAWRGGERWVQRFERKPLPRATARPTLLRHGGVYLITGGFGGIGRKIAEYLARGFAARLILLGRSGVPAPDELERQLAARDETDAATERLRTVRQLEASGAEVLAAAADVADSETMARVFEAARARFGRIDGVFHAAGIAGGGMIQLRDRRAIARVLAPKVTGTRVLEALIARDQPDFVVLASSLAAVVGRPGQVDYCAANAFLDAFARDHASRTGIHTVSIDWPEWRGVGMAAPAASRPADIRQPRHPLLGERTTAANGVEVYTTRLRVDTHWVLDEHRLVGTAVVPGTSYIEMVRAALADRAAGRCIEIQDLFFLAPLRVGNDQTREVRLVLTPAGDGFEFFVESDVPVADGIPSGAARYASGRVSVVDASPPPPTELAAVILRCPRREVAREEDREEDLGPRWQNVIASQVGDDEVLVQLELPEDFASDLDAIHYHPALMDRATGRAQEHLAAGAFLPILYRRLRIYRRVPRKVFSHARYRRDLDPSGETLTFDTLVVDDEGAPLVEIEGFTQKRINDSAAAIKAFSSQLAPAESRPSREQPGMSPIEGIETLERILASRLGPQVVVSPVDLAVELEGTDEAARARVLDAVSRMRPRPPQLHPRPSLDNEYCEPRTEIERTLASAWQQTLGLERTGIHDNFFALGGDSVQAIQIIARLASAGLRLTPQQFFQHQTIAEIASVLAAGPQDPVPAAIPESPAEGGSQLFPLARLDEEGFDQLSALIDDADASSPTSARVQVASPGPQTSSRSETMRFSLFYFADEDAAHSRDKYRLYLDGARFADQHGFEAVWTPERHFHTKGGLYPNPSVLSAALAAATRRIHLRAGSVVLPLHSPLRVAEEWAVVDNLSGGRVGISFTSGWQPNDFALFPAHYRDKRAVMFRGIEDVRRLWRGESIPGRDGAGEERQLKVFPRPLQPELPVWLTCSGDPEMFRRAGEIGANILTALLTQTIDEAAVKIALYRQARAASGHDPATGVVTMMIHTFVGTDAESVLKIVREPLCNYLKSHVALIETGAASLGIEVNPETIEEHLDALAAFAFERYYRTASLIGTPQHCLPMVRRLSGIGVNEAACLVDFGVAPDSVLGALSHLADLKELARTAAEQEQPLRAHSR